MASSAFKSTTKRTPIGATSNTDNSSSSDRAHRRSRSLSRFSRRPETASDFGEAPAPRGRFVNTVRGSGTPEISLDDLAIELFSLKDSEDKRGRSSRRCSEISPASSATVSSQRRGRSVSRQTSRVGDGKSTFNKASGGGRTASNANSRRRSVSVVRYQKSESQSDIDHSQNSRDRTNMKSFNGGNSQMPSLQKPTASSHRRIGRSQSQRSIKGP